MEKEDLGFTLVEVLISIMLLILTTVSLLGSLDQAFRHYRTAELRWRATIEVWNQIELLRADGVEVVEGTLTIDDVREADEIFSSGNHAKIRAVTQFEDRELQPGPIGRRAKELYFEYAQDFSVF